MDRRLSRVFIEVRAPTFEETLSQEYWCYKKTGETSWA
jgi:hypothetical protein